MLMMSCTLSAHPGLPVLWVVCSWARAVPPPSASAKAPPPSSLAEPARKLLRDDSLCPSSTLTAGDVPRGRFSVIFSYPFFCREVRNRPGPEHDDLRDTWAAFEADHNRRWLLLSLMLQEHRWSRIYVGRTSRNTSYERLLGEHLTST